jgi:sphingomyelin phosphodiesterase 3
MVHSIQLNEIQNWLKNFKEKTFNPNTEIILFDVVCGDFNIDNMSPVDKISYENEIFSKYSDPLSLKPGLDRKFFDYLIH